MKNQPIPDEASDRVCYFPDVDAFHVELTTAAPVIGTEARRDVLTYLDENEAPCSIRIEHASRHPRRVTETLQLLREELGFTADR